MSKTQQPEENAVEATEAFQRAILRIKNSLNGETPKGTVRLQKTHPHLFAKSQNTDTQHPNADLITPETQAKQFPAKNK